MATAGPFVVHESDAPLTVPEDPDLATDTRAVERAEFDAHMAAKMQQEEVGSTHNTQCGRQLTPACVLWKWSVSMMSALWSAVRALVDPFACRNCRRSGAARRS